MTTASTILISGYTRAPYGGGPGLTRFELLPDGTLGEQQGAAAEVVNPSFVSASEDMLLAVEEQPAGAMVALDAQTLSILGRAPSGGADPCHVALVDGSVWVANYSSGTAAVLPATILLGTGNGVGAGPEASGVNMEVKEPQPTVLAHPGSGPVGDRQGESHAHQVTATQWGTVLVSDLGTDRVDEYSATTRARLGSAELPPGTGPRHVAIKGDFLLVAGELDGYLHILHRTPRAADFYWKWLLKTPLALTAHEVEDAAEFFPSHIELSADGNKLYAAVRGPNTLLVLDVQDLADLTSSEEVPTAPRVLQQVSSGGNWPRHFAVGTAASGVGKMYVANQLSNNIAVLELDGAGLFSTAPIQSVDFGSPTCIVIP